MTENLPDKAQNKSEILFYQAEDGKTKLDVRLENETINEHIKNIYEEKELEESPTMRKFGNSEFSTKPANFYNLDVICSGRYYDFFA